MRAIVVTGGIPQIELIKNLKSRGIFTILIDGNDSPVAKDYADKFVQMKIFDVEAVKHLAIVEHADFLITVCADQVLLVVAQVSEILGLPCYISYDTAIKVSNKKYMKQILAQNDIPTAKYVVADTYSPQKFNGLKYPIVVKPVDAYSSKGVRKVKNIEELEAGFYEAQKICRDSKSVIVEEFCEGEEISVDAFVCKGKAKILCITNSMKINKDGRFVIYRGKYPAIVSDETVRKIEVITQQIADAFSLYDTPLLIQMIANENSVYVLEFCARTGGNMKYLLIKHICGVDVIDAVVDLTLGKTPQIKLKEPENKYIVNDFLYCKKGRFDHLVGFDEMLEQGYITDYHQIRPKGFSVQGINSSSDRIAGITIQADSIDELNKKQRYAVDHVAIIDSLGNDMMRHDLIPDLSE